MKKNQNKKIKAFSLIELSVVITIIALISAAALSLSVTDSGNEKVKITNQRIQDIYKAMGIHLAKKGYLPCPAPINKAKTDPSYGISGNCTTTPPAYGSGYWQSNTYSNLYYGMVPVQTLELPNITAEDGFGSKLAYAVLQGFTDPAKFGTSHSTTMTSSPNMIKIMRRIYTPSSSFIIETNTTISNYAMFVIISYGANKFGAWNAATTTQNGASSLDVETWNYVTGNIDTSTAGKADFYTDNGSNFPFIIGYNKSGFDDILFYKTRTEMVSDFKLYNLLPCSATLTQGSYTWTGSDNIKYGELVESSTQCSPGLRNGVYAPVKRCGAFGDWEDYLVKDCS